MDEAKRRLVLAWLAKAEDDLRSARLLIAEENRLYAAGVFHCQQAVEKALKAWLTSSDRVFPKTHDLETLLHLCGEKEPGFGLYEEQARALTPLATEFRYPGDVLEPTPEQAGRILGQATEVYEYSVRLIQAALAET